ncbi:MAG: hypothetical protein F4X99_01815 [Gammaproteobacteria bacterium]|nr:hypothetical protein [Gammaproteobacteria bacterium]
MAPPADARFSIRRHPPLRVLLPTLVVVITLVGAVLLFSRPTAPEQRRDAQLCPVDANDLHGGSAMFLFDFRKPLGSSGDSTPGALLREAIHDLGENTEIVVYSLSDVERAPRVRVGRLCKPYDNAALQPDMAKDQRTPLRDCDDLPAQLTPELRESATGFCGQRDLLVGRVDALAAEAPRGGQEVPDAYLVEAIEDIALDLRQRARPHALYVFSDMLQHAPWYSHLDQEWTSWNYDGLAEALQAQNWFVDRASEPTGLRVEVFYLPRTGLTDQPRALSLHQDFWRQYFAGADVTFHQQEPAAAYAARRVTNVPTEAERVARERAEAERLLQQVREEQDALRREQLALEEQAAEQRRLEAEQLRAEEEQARQRERRRAEAERQRQEAEQRARPGEEAPSEPVEQELPVAPEPSDETAAPDEPPEPALEVAATDPPDPGPVPEPETAGPRFCALTLATGAEGSSPAYPRGGRMNFGPAVITVRYEVDERGATVDDQVTMVPEQSRADRERYLDLFVEVAVETVRAWTFTAADPADRSCVRRQVRTTSFQFTYR